MPLYSFPILALILVVFGLLEWYFYRQVVYPCAGELWGKRLLGGSIVSIFVGLLATISFFMMQVGGEYQSLISTFLILLLANFIFKLLFLLFSLPQFLFVRCGRIWVRRIALLIGIGWLGLIGKGVYDAYVPQVRSFTVYSDRLPAAFDGYRIAFVSDIHTGLLGSDSSLLERAGELICQIDPDLLLLGGDIVSLSSREIEPFIGVLRSWEAKDGKFSIFGNHDYGHYAHWIEGTEAKRSDARRLASLQRSAGYELLNNRNLRIGRGADSIQLIGVGDWEASTYSQFGHWGEATLGRNYSDFTLLLSHNPEHFRTLLLPEDSIDLTLSGHTHAWQFVIRLGDRRISPASSVYPLWGGYYESEVGRMIVSEGLGATLYRMRIGTPAEVTEVILRRRP